MKELIKKLTQQDKKIDEQINKLILQIDEIIGQMRDLIEKLKELDKQELYILNEELNEKQRHDAIMESKEEGYKAVETEEGQVIEG